MATERRILMASRLRAGITARLRLVSAVPWSRTSLLSRPSCAPLRRIVAPAASSALTSITEEAALPPPVLHDAFDVAAHARIPELSCVATLYVHRQTGAEVLSVASRDEEKVFGIAFRTPPRDDTGVAHILEHSAICGSESYPAKDPFLILLKGSLHTYLNAMTYPDRTVFPLASPNATDFYNLVNVYLDAVLFPNLKRHAFAQEGWHVEHEGEGGSTPRALAYKGVVFNEMKGVYSSSASVRDMALYRALFTGHTYGLSSGGDPLAIPRLSYDAFRAFHAQHYHPSNSRTFFFGDDDPATRLRVVDAFFKRFTKDAGKEVQSRIALMPLRDKHAHVRVGVPAAAASDDDVEGSEGAVTTATADPAAAQQLEDVYVDYSVGAAGTISVRPPLPAACLSGPLARQHASSVSWVLHDVTLDDDTRVALGILSHLLMHNQVATLYKALTDSALGAAVIGGGVDDSLQQAVFSAGLKGVHVDNVTAVQELVLDTLQRAAKDGFSQEHLDSVFNSVEFALREYASGGGPRGLSLLLSLLPAWMYGRDVMHELRFEAPLARVRAAAARDPQYFQALVQKYLLSNHHRVYLHAYPDPAYHERRDAAEAAQLTSQASSMSDADHVRLQQETEALQQWQATPDPQHVVDSIPTLRVSDLPTAATFIPHAVVTLPLPSSKEQGATTEPFRSIRALRETTDVFATAAHVVERRKALDVHKDGRTSYSGSRNTEILLHDQPTNGIAYFNFHFDLSPLPARLLPYVPLFCWATTSCGTAHTSEVAMSHALGTYTGGVGVGASSSDVPGSRTHALPFLSVHGKALHAHVPRALELTRELLLDATRERKERVLHYLRSSITRAETGLVSSGHRYAGGVLSSLYTKSGWVNDQMGGLSHLYAAREMLRRIETGDAGGFDGVCEDLREIAAHVLRRDNVLVSVTADGNNLQLAQQAATQLLESLPVAGVSASARAHTRFGSGWMEHSSSSETHERELPRAPLPVGLHRNATAPQHLGIVVPTQVNYVAKAAACSAPGTIAHGSADVIMSVLNNGYVWERVRMQGGAYGGFCGLNRLSGVLSFGSYRDPNVATTLDVFAGAAAHLRDMMHGDSMRAELDKAIISTIGSIDAPQSPAEKGDTSTARYLAGVTDAAVQKRRDQVLATSPSDAADIVHKLQQFAAEGHACVVASEEAFADYHRDTTRPRFEIIRPLLHGATKQ